MSTSTGAMTEIVSRIKVCDSKAKARPGRTKKHARLQSAAERRKVLLKEHAGLKHDCMPYGMPCITPIHRQKLNTRPCQQCNARRRPCASEPHTNKCGMAWGTHAARSTHNCTGGVVGSAVVVVPSSVASTEGEGGGRRCALAEAPKRPAKGLGRRAKAPLPHAKRIVRPMMIHPMATHGLRRSPAWRGMQHQAVHARTSCMA